MKRYVVLIGALAAFGCNDNKERKEISTDVETTTDSTVINNEKPGYNPESKLYVWRASSDYTKEKNKVVSPVMMNTDSLIKGLNEYYQNVYIEKVKQAGDTLYTVIKDSEYLTQQMGSTGAEMYLADVVLNLTAVPGTRYVKIEMEEGDHMQPGTWSAADFKNYKEVIL